METFIYLPPTGGGASFVGQTNGLPIPAGEIGEVVTQNQAITTVGIGATNVYGTALTLSLSAGVWMIGGVVFLDQNGANLSNQIIGGIATSAGGTPSVYERVELPIQILDDPLRITLPVKFVNIAAPADYYLTTRFTYDSGTPQHGGRLYAMRYR